MAKDEMISFSKTVTFRKKKAQWLNTEINELGDIFDLTVRVHNTIQGNGAQTLQDLLLYSKKELLAGKPINIDALASRQEKYLAEEVNNRKTARRTIKIGAKSMEEIEHMLKNLGMKLRG